MKGIEWGRLYEDYHNNSYDPNEISKKLRELYADPYVKSRKGIFEYLLGGSNDTKLLDIRVFVESVKNSVYAKQTEVADKKGISNCPLCAIGNDSNNSKIWKQTEMEADHVTAWSKGGATVAKNCQMLCKIHNRAKGNK
jgi:5-methylcytosine-specific restriction endonuclease McrA